MTTFAVLTILTTSLAAAPGSSTAEYRATARQVIVETPAYRCTLDASTGALVNLAVPKKGTLAIGAVGHKGHASELVAYHAESREVQSIFSQTVHDATPKGVIPDRGHHTHGASETGSNAGKDDGRATGKWLTGYGRWAR